MAEKNPNKPEIFVEAWVIMKMVSISIKDQTFLMVKSGLYVAIFS